MKLVLLLLFLFGLLGGGVNIISQMNRLAQEAAAAYADKNYAEAIAVYEYLLNDLEVEDNQLRVNLAHACYRAGLLDRAKKEYQLLTNHSYRNTRAVALLQLGNIAAAEKKFKRALSYYRSVLLTEPTNSNAQYNYELLKKYLDLHPELAAAEEEEEQVSVPEEGTPPPADATLVPQPQPDSNGTDRKELDNPQPEGSPQSGQNEQQGNGLGNSGSGKGSNGQAGEQEQKQNIGNEEGQEQGLNRQKDEIIQNNTQLSGGSEFISELDTQAQTQKVRLQRMNISSDKAQVLLNAMRNVELQYIQQLPKKTSSKPDKTKPDW